MNIISNPTIFDYIEIEILGDLERLKLFLENIDDEQLCKTLESERKNGRDDFPIRVMLNLVYAMKIFGHRSVESFRRELSRNSSLRKACGLKEEDYLYLGKRKTLIPPARVFTNFLKKLVQYQSLLDEIFESNVKFMYEGLDGFGEDIAIDGKIIETYASKNNEQNNDLRSEHDASWMVKEYHSNDGKTKKKSYFGYEAHILCDANYGLPIDYRLESANISEQIMADKLIENLEKYKLRIMRNLIGDKGYDNGVRNKYLKEKYNVNSIVDIRHLWKDEVLREIENKPIAYDEDGEVYYIVDIKNGEYEKLIYLGYDRQRKCLRYGHVAKPGVYRIPLSTDYRIFTPLARDSDKFKKLYKKRTEIERLNGRIDRDYMFNDHFIRGKKKMNMMLSLTFIIMLTMAKGHIKNKQENIRSLVKI